MDDFRYCEWCGSYQSMEDMYWVENKRVCHGCATDHEEEGHFDPEMNKNN